MSWYYSMNTLNIEIKKNNGLLIYVQKQLRPLPMSYTMLKNSIQLPVENVFKNFSVYLTEIICLNCLPVISTESFVELNFNR